jgi:hypothetical protein
MRSRYGVLGSGLVLPIDWSMLTPLPPGEHELVNEEAVCDAGGSDLRARRDVRRRGGLVTRSPRRRQWCLLSLALAAACADGGSKDTDDTSTDATGIMSSTGGSHGSDSSCDSSGMDASSAGDSSESGFDGPVSPSYGPCETDQNCPAGETCSAHSEQTAPQCRAACTDHFDCPPPDGGDTFPDCAADGLCYQWCTYPGGLVSGECGPNHMCFFAPGAPAGACGLPP